MTHILPSLIALVRCLDRAVTRSMHATAYKLRWDVCVTQEGCFSQLHSVQLQAELTVAETTADDYLT